MIQLERPFYSKSNTRAVISRYEIVRDFEVGQSEDAQAVMVWSQRIIGRFVRWLWLEDAQFYLAANGVFFLPFTHDALPAISWNGSAWIIGPSGRPPSRPPRKPGEV